MKSLGEVTHLTIFWAVVILLTAQGCVEIELPEGVQMTSKEEVRLDNFLWEADIAYRSGEYQKALDNCEEALQTSKTVEDLQRISFLLNDIVETCEKLEQHEELPPMSEELANLIAETQAERAREERAKMLLQEARKDAVQGAFQEAFAKLEEAQDIHEVMVSSAKEWISVEMALVVIMHKLGRDEEALVKLEPRLLALIERLGTEDRIVSQWLDSLARAHEKLGQYEQAEVYYQQVQAMKQQLGDERAQESGAYNTGKLYEKQGLYEKALELYQQERTRKKTAGDTKGEIESLQQIVWVYHQIPQYEKALAVELEQLELQRTSGVGDVGMTLQRIGSIYGFLGQYEKALRTYHQALARYQQLEGTQGAETYGAYGTAQVLDSIGRIYADLGQYQKTVTLQLQALKLSAQTEAAQMLQQARRIEAQYGANLEKMDLKEQVDEFYRLAEAAREGKGQTVHYPLMEIAESYQMLGQYETVQQILQQTLAIVRENADHVLQPLRQKLETTKKLAETSEQQKAQLKMIEENLRMQTIYKKSDEAYVLDKTGSFYENWEQYDEALKFYQQALTVYREFQTSELAGLRRSEGDVLGHIGTVYVALEQNERALESYQEALAICGELNQNKEIVQDLWCEGHLFDQIGTAYEESGQYEQAVTFHQQALEVAKKSGIPERIWHTSHVAGRSLAKLGKPAEALQHYEQALDIIETLRAGLTEKEHKYAFMRERLYIYDELIDWLQTLHQQHPDKGYDRKALEIFERKQGRVFLEEMGQSGARFFAGLPEAVAQRERALASQLPQTRKQLADERAKPVAEQNREFLQNLQQRERTLLSEQESLQNTIKNDYPDYYALQYPQPVALAELQTRVLQPDELMLVYAVMNAKTCLWVIGQQEFELYSLDIGEDALAEKVTALRNALSHGWRTERGLSFEDRDASDQVEQKPVSFTQASHELYAILIPEAIRPLLTSPQDSLQGKTLNIIPTGPLYALPFEALMTRPAKDAHKAHYLIEDIPISYLSSASLLNILREAQARRTTTARYPLLAFAHPAYKDETLQESDSVRSLRTQSYRNLIGGNFIELPETADEAKAIADLFEAPQESTPLQLRENASYAGVIDFNNRERLDDYQYLIFAMHGVLPGEVDKVSQSALVFSDNYLTTADVFGLQLNARLVSLSACNTGRGTQVKGEGVKGLTRAFMYAGTPAVAVTLWSVESLSAKDLDIGFFRHLKAGLPPARALQAIKLQMLRGEEGKNYRHPYYWAPFVVFGDGM